MDEMLSSWPKLQRRSRSDIHTHNCTQLPKFEKKHSFHMENTHAEGVPLSLFYCFFFFFVGGGDLRCSC